MASTSLAPDGGRELNSPRSVAAARHPSSAERADQPGGAVADDQRRAAQPALAEPGEKPLPRVAGLTGRRLQPDQGRM